MEQANRRQLATRGRAWPSAIARGLARVGVTPNMVSVASIAFAAVSAWAFWRGSMWFGQSTWIWLVIAAAGIQLRLLCNLLDGLLAIEGGLKSKTGELYNEIPDRICDIMILLGAGIALRWYEFGVTLGVAATVLALLTAYIRLLGGSLGFRQDFVGPMAKQHRMFALTVGALAAAFEVAFRGTTLSLYFSVAIIALGTLGTCIRRTMRIAAQLRSR
jgi:phosphatidylglycerophosphate synthase